MRSLGIRWLNSLICKKEFNYMKNFTLLFEQKSLVENDAWDYQLHDYFIPIKKTIYLFDEIIDTINDQKDGTLNEKRN